MRRKADALPYTWEQPSTKSSVWLRLGLLGVLLTRRAARFVYVDRFGLVPPFDGWLIRILRFFRNSVTPRRMASLSEMPSRALSACNASSNSPGIRSEYRRLIATVTHRITCIYVCQEAPVRTMWLTVRRTRHTVGALRNATPVRRPCDVPGAQTRRPIDPPIVTAVKGRPGTSA